MATIRLPNDFKEFLQLLNEHQVDYLLVGGYAVGFYGYPRATGDMDVWVDSRSENANKLVSVFQAFGFGGEVTSELFQQPDNVIRIGNPPLRLEVLTTISGVTFQDAYPRRKTESIDGVLVNIIGLDQLKINKRASGRHKDLNDLENLP